MLALIVQMKMYKRNGYHPHIAHFYSFISANIPFKNASVSVVGSAPSSLIRVKLKQSSLPFPGLYFHWILATRHTAKRKNLSSSSLVRVFTRIHEMEFSSKFKKRQNYHIDHIF